MSRIKSYYEDALEEPPVTVEGEQAPVLDDTKRLAEVLDQSPEDVTRVLALVDGLEAFPAPPPFMDYEPLLPDVSLEGFMDTVETLWQRIKDWLRRLREWFRSEGMMVHASVQTLLYQVRNLEVAIKGSTRVGRRGTFDVGGNLRSISVFYKPPKDISALTASLRMLHSVGQSYFDYLDNVVIPGVGRIASRIRMIEPGLNVAPLHEELTQFLKDVAPERLRGPLRMAPIPNQPGKEGTLHLLGNQRLVFSGRQGNQMGDVLSQQLRLNHSEINPRPMPPSVLMPHFGRVASNQCTEQTIRLLTLLETHTNQNAMRKRTTVLDSIESAMDGLMRRIERADSVQHKGMLEEVMQISRVLTDWLNNPYHGIVGAGVRASRGAAKVCRNNIA